MGDVKRFRVYIAGPYVARDALRQFADELAAIGMACTSSWLTSDCDVLEAQGAAANLSDDEVAKDCRDDLGAIDKSDAVVQFTGLSIEAMGLPGAVGWALHSGGRHVEIGYAIAKGKPVIVVGDAENIFQRSLGIPAANWHEAVLALVKLERAQERLEEDVA